MLTGYCLPLLRGTQEKVYFLQLNFLTKRLAFQLMNLSFQIPYVCVLLTVSPSSKKNSLFIGPSVCVCVCTHTPLMKLHPRLHHHLLFLLRLFLMSSHFLWASDKPTEQRENRALYWDACQDSPWIYGQQTAFITHPRGKVKKSCGGGKGKGGKQSDPLLHFPTDPSKLEGTFPGKRSVNHHRGGN